MCGAHSSVEIQNNAGSSFLIADAAASFACKCSEIKTAEGAELNVEQRRGCISQFSINSDDDVVAFQLNIYNTEGSHAPWVSLNLLEFRISLSRPLKLLEKWKFAYSPWKLLENWANLVSKNLILDFQTGLYILLRTLLERKFFVCCCREVSDWRD